MATTFSVAAAGLIFQKSKHQAFPAYFLPACLGLSVGGGLVREPFAYRLSKPFSRGWEEKTLEDSA